jgi:small subunit ribosomal protein S1
MSEDIQEMLNTSTLDVGDTVTARITAVDDKKAVADIGYKFAGIIPIRELSALRIENPSEVVAVDDEVKTVVVKIDEEAEVVILSKREADAQGAWGDLVQKYNNRQTFEVTIHDVVKGGLVTDVGVRGFIPASLVDRQFVEDLGEFKGQTIRVQVAEVDAENNKLILSRRAVLDDEYQHEVEEKLKSLQQGNILEGTVQRLTNFGAFIDVGGVDGLVHVSELAWYHVNDPAEVVQPGQVVKVKVLKVDPESGRVSLSIKEAQPSPWQEGAREFQEGDIVNGVVRRLVDFGAFVELKPGLEGLVHVSQISNQHVAVPSDVLEEGQQVKVKVLAIEPDRKRISLSIKEAADSHERPRKENQKYVQPQEDISGTGATLGDLFRDLFKK